MRKNRKRLPQKNLATYSAKKNTDKLQATVAMIIIIMILVILYLQIDREIMPSVMAMAELEATTLATEAINKSIAQTLVINQTTLEDLVRVCVHVFT